MSKKWKFLCLFLISCLLCAFGIGLAACSKTDEVIGIKVTSLPFVTEYEVNDSFDPTGLTVKKEYKSGKLETIENYTLSSPDMTTAGEKTVTVTWDKYKTEFKITVAAEVELKGIELAQLPSKTRYSLGEEFSLTGLIINAKWSDGTTTILPSTEYEASQVDMSTTGEKEVVISYAGQQVSFTIEVLRGTSFIPCGEEESPFLFENYLTDTWGTHRSADYNKGSDEKGIGAYFTYAFNAGSKLKTALLCVSYCFRTTMEVSFDGVSYTPVLQAVAIDNTLFSDEYRLETLLDGTSGKLDFDDNAGLIYVRFRSTAQDLQGFGADVFNFGFYYTLEDETSDFVLNGDPYSAMHEILFDADTAAEEKFLYDESSTGIFEYTEEHAELNGLCNRYTTSKSGYFIYAFDVHGAMSDAVLQVFLANRTKIDVSYDGSEWIEVLSKTTNGTANVVLKLKDFAGFTDNDGILYVKFSNAVDEDDFGATMIQFRLCYTLSDETSYQDPDGIEFQNPLGGNLQFSCIGGAEETKYVLEEKDSYIFGDNQFRTFNKDGYVLYGFDFGGKLQAATLNMHIGQLYRQVQISFDGKTWTTILNENPAQSGGETDFVYDLSTTEGFAANTGVVYLRCSGIPGNEQGFDLCLYSVEITYGLEGTFATYPEVAAADPISINDGSLSFSANGSAEETKYVLEEKDTYIFGDNQFRTFNKDGYVLYGFDFGGKLQAATLNMHIGQLYRQVQISFDGKTWTTVLNENPAQSGGETDFVYDLSTTEGFAANTGVVYLRCSGILGNTQGFDLCLYSVEITYGLEGTFETYPEVVAADPIVNETQTEGEIDFKTDGGEVDLKYYVVGKNDTIYEQGQTKFRGTNSGDSYFVYGLDFGARLASAKVFLSLNQQYQRIYCSFDGENWIEILNVVSDKGEYVFEYDLSAISGFAQNDGTVYLLFASVPGQDSFGICLYNIRAEYVLDGTFATYPEVAAADPISINDGSLSFSANGSAEEMKYILEEKDSYIFGDNQFRTFRNGDGYVLYGFDFGGKLSQGKLDLFINQKYQQIQVSFDGTTWHTILEMNPSTMGEYHFVYDLSTVEGFADNTGVVYLRCGGYPGNTQGFDLCILSVSAEYELEGVSGVPYPPVTKADAIA